MMLVISIALPIILLCVLKIYRKAAGKTLAPPAPPGLPLIGNLHQIGTAKLLHVYLHQLSKKYGPIIQMKLGSVPLIVVSSPELAKEVLQNQDLAFCSRPKLLGQQKLSYNGLDIVFCPYGDYWKELRKITAVHLFNLKKTQSFRPIREDEVSRMITRISGLASSSSARDRVVNLGEMAMGLGSTIICRVAFGKRYGDEQGFEKRRFDELLREVQAMAAAFFVSDYFPAFGWVDKLSGLMSRLDMMCMNMESFYRELIDEHLDPSRVKTMEDGDDILDTLIQLKEQKSFSFDLTWDHIKALLMDIFVAASDSSASIAVWTMTALIKAPKVMKKLQSEIRNLVGKKGKVDEDDLPKLAYLKAVIKEAFRLYPPTPLLVPRETRLKCSLDGYQIEPKTLVFINAWAIARDPEYWDNPDEFLPERFLNNDVDIKGKDFELIPFGSGRRLCPGMSIGLVTVELTIANLVYSFDWELPPGIQPQDVDTDALPGIAVHKKNPLLLLPINYLV